MQHNRIAEVRCVLPDGWNGRRAERYLMARTPRDAAVVVWCGVTRVPRPTLVVRTRDGSRDRSAETELACGLMLRQYQGVL